MYRTNGGATTDFGVAVQQEQRAFAGLKLVRHIFGDYHADDVDVEVVAPGAIRLKSGFRFSDALGRRPDNAPPENVVLGWGYLGRFILFDFLAIALGIFLGPKVSERVFLIWKTWETKLDGERGFRRMIGLNPDGNIKD